MPNKRVDNLKDATDRRAGQEWQKGLRVKNLTTREWNDAAYMSSEGMSDDNIRKEILKNRKK